MLFKDSDKSLFGDTINKSMDCNEDFDFFNDPNVQKYMQEQNLSSAEFLEEEKKLKSDIDYLT